MGLQLGLPRMSGAKVASVSGGRYSSGMNDRNPTSTTAYDSIVPDNGLLVVAEHPASHDAAASFSEIFLLARSLSCTCTVSYPSQGYLGKARYNPCTDRTLSYHQR